MIWFKKKKEQSFEQGQMDTLLNNKQLIIAKNLLKSVLGVNVQQFFETNPLTGDVKKRVLLSAIIELVQEVEGVGVQLQQLKKENREQEKNTPCYVG